MMTEMELILLALNNHRKRRVISHSEQNEVFVFYMENIKKQGLSVDVYFSFLKAEIKSMCRGSELSALEKSNLIRKVKEYLYYSEERERRLRVTQELQARHRTILR